MNETISTITETIGMTMETNINARLTVNINSNNLNKLDPSLWIGPQDQLNDNE